MDCLQHQLKEHYTWWEGVNQDNDYENIYPNTDWTKEEYEELFSYIGKGWLVPDDTGNSKGYIINEDWEGEPMWKPPDEEKTRKEEALEEWNKRKEEAIKEWYDTINLFHCIIRHTNKKDGTLIYYHKKQLLRLYNNDYEGDIAIDKLCNLFRNFPELYEEDCFVITEKTFRIKNYNELTTAYATYKQLQDPR